MTPATERLYRAWRKLAEGGPAGRVSHPATEARYQERVRVAKARFDRAAAAEQGKPEPVTVCRVCGEESPDRSSVRGRVHRWGPRSHHFIPA